LITFGGSQFDPGNGTQVADDPVADKNILAVFPFGEDRATLDRILKQSGCRLRFAWSLEDMQTVLRSYPIAAVISESRLPDGRTWRDVLETLLCLADPPPLVVADRLADDRLWAEVLNLGAYDLLIKPFHPAEVLRTVGMACRCGNQLPAEPPAGLDAGASKASGHS